MDDVYFSLLLLAFTVGTLVVTRSHAMLTKVIVEAALLVLIGGFLFWHGTSPLPHFGAMPMGTLRAWYRALAVVWWLIGARLVVNVTVIARGRDPRSREARLFSELTAAIIYITVVLIILNSVLDLNINSLLATSGVVAIVLGLALQNTLADVFSGIAVGLEQPFHVGDRVSLGNDIEGVIVQMNWRSVRVQTDDDDIATVPNSIVAKGQIINRSVPTRRRATSVEVTAPAGVPTATVFELLRQATMLCPDILASPPASITMQRSGIRTSGYAIRFFVPDSPSMASAKSKLLRQTSRMFRHAGTGTNTPVPPIDLLGGLVIFEALTQEDLEKLVEHLAIHIVEPGDVIFAQGTNSTSIFVIAAGVMEMVRQAPHGSGQTVGHVGPGEYVGEIGLISGNPRACTMKALTHGRVLEVPGECIQWLLKTNKALNAAMELSVRRGLASLDRDDAALEAQPVAQMPDLFARIEAFFGLAAVRR